MSRIRPSALPKLAACPCFEGAPAGEAAQRGILMDTALRLFLQGDLTGFQPLADQDRDNVRWAAEKLKELSEDHVLEVRESELKLRVPVMKHVGTADVLCQGKHWVGDLKTGQIRDYEAQMACYAWALMDTHFAGEWTTHLIFCDQREVVTRVFQYEEAKSIVEGIVAEAASADKQPRACEYCGWCALQDRCPAIVQPVTNTLQLVEESEGLTAMRERLLAEPDRLGQFLVAAQIFTKELVTPLRDEAKRRLAHGEQVPGWKLTEAKGREYVDHIAIVQTAAAARCGLDSLVLAMGGKMSGEDFRAWCASLNREVDESLVRVGEGTMQLRQAKASAKKKENKQND